MLLSFIIEQRHHLVFGLIRRDDLARSLAPLRRGLRAKPVDTAENIAFGFTSGTLGIARSAQSCAAMKTIDPLAGCLFSPPVCRLAC
jgi:hypothetical protein